MLVLASLGTGPVQAAGCHVPERAILGVRTAGERDGRTKAWEMADISKIAPPILTHLPCPGEDPHLPVVAELSVVAACLATAEIEPALNSESLPAFDDTKAIPPHPFRLDRPPRGE
jgi:hypothetical protein